MRIITSHEIEIEGQGQQNFREVEKDILEGIRTGKLSMEELSSKYPNFKVEKVEPASTDAVSDEHSPRPIDNPRTDINSKKKRIEDIVEKATHQCK